jgi:hypothetical protein
MATQKTALSAIVIDALSKILKRAIFSACQCHENYVRLDYIAIASQFHTATTKASPTTSSKKERGGYFFHIIGTGGWGRHR